MIKQIQQRKSRSTVKRRECHKRALARKREALNAANGSTVLSPDRVQDAVVHVDTPEKSHVDNPEINNQGIDSFGDKHENERKKESLKKKDIDNVVDADDYNYVDKLEYKGNGINFNDKPHGKHESKHRFIYDSVVNYASLEDCTFSEDNSVSLYWKTVEDMQTAKFQEQQNQHFPSCIDPLTQASYKTFIDMYIKMLRKTQSRV